MEPYQSILLARQPIYSPNQDLYGFELFYRSEELEDALNHSDMSVTSELLVNLCTSAYDENICVNKPIFLNVDLEFLETESFIPATFNNVILEILETIPVNNELVSSVKKLKRKGYMFALDNYIFEPRHEVLLPFLSIVKVDVSSISHDALKKQIDSLNDLGVTLLAKNIEDRETYELCKTLGFDLFQGFYLDKPATVVGRKVSSSQLVLLNLLSELSKPDITVDEVSQLISCDPKLVFKMLKIINSPIFPFRREVQNIKEAVVILGLENIKRWAMVLSMMSESSQPNEYYRTLLTRAKTCEFFASRYRESNPDDYFTLGLFSGLDTILNLEMTEIVQEVNFAEELKKELLIDSSAGQGALQIVRALERQDHQFLNMLNQELFRQLGDSYWDGARWADEQMQLLVQ